MSFDWQPAWLNLQYQKTPLPIRLSCEYVSMLFHIHSPWSYVASGPLSWKTDTHAESPAWWGIWKGWLIIQRFVCLCKRLGALWWAFGLMYSPVVLYCRMRWRELCPMVVVLARAPLTRWRRRWNMLIKLKTTSKNLHQIVTLVVSGATVRFICGETCACWHVCIYVCVRWYLCVWRVCVCVCSLNLCHAASIMMLVFFEWVFDKSCHFSSVFVTVSELISPLT